MEIPKDIIIKVIADFPNIDDQRHVHVAISDLSVNEVYRVVRCMLVAASGDISRFDELYELAKTDYRDVIVAGEYDYETDKRINDFSKPFSMTAGD